MSVSAAGLSFQSGICNRIKEQMSVNAAGIFKDK